MENENRAIKFAVNQGLDLHWKTNMVQLTSKLVGIQSQLSDTPILSARARGIKIDDKSLNKFYNNTLLERIWTVRGTMHAIATEDWPLFQKALEPEWDSRWSRFMDKHITKEQQKTLEKWIINKISNGPATRSELVTEAISGYGDLPWVKYAFSSWGGLLKSLCYKNIICLNPGIEGNEYVLRKDASTIHTLKLSSDAALYEFYNRYINAYGPATYKDFVYWSGTTVKRVKQILKESPPKSQDINVSSNKPLVNLLPKFDPYVLSHKDKFYIDEKHYTSVYKKAGHIEAVILKNGLIVGTWKKKKGLLDEYTVFDKYKLDSSEIEKEATRMKLLNNE